MKIFFLFDPFSPLPPFLVFPFLKPASLGPPSNLRHVPVFFFSTNVSPPTAQFQSFVFFFLVSFSEKVHVVSFKIVLRGSAGSFMMCFLCSQPLILKFHSTRSSPLLVIVLPSVTPLWPRHALAVTSARLAIEHSGIESLFRPLPHLIVCYSGVDFSLTTSLIPHHPS